MKVLTRAQVKRVYVLEEEEYDILACYVTSAKVGLLKLRRSGGSEMGSGHMTQITVVNVPFPAQAIN